MRWIGGGRVRVLRLGNDDDDVEKGRAFLECVRENGVNVDERVLAIAMAILGIFEDFEDEKENILKMSKEISKGRGWQLLNHILLKVHNKGPIETTLLTIYPSHRTFFKGRK